MQPGPSQAPRVRVAVASPEQRVAIMRICTDVYAVASSAHPTATPWDLAPVLDQQSVYVIATRAQQVLGFIGITPPTSPRYALETYLPRDQLPIPFDAHVYELRLLTVDRDHRRSRLAALLMYAAFRWVEAQGGTRIVAVSQRNNLTLFEHVGLRPVGPAVRTDTGEYVILSATVADMREAQRPLIPFIQRLEAVVDWDLGVPFL
jgi:N-acyl-L-homoserine lactone synthetase